jgi:transposase-like protein
VDSQVVIDAILEVETALIAQLVDEGYLTQEGADELLADVRAMVEGFVEDSWADPAWGPGMGVDWFAVAAETIGIDEEALSEALEGGQSLADIAQAHGVDPQAVIDAIIEAERALASELVAEGEITQEEADEWLSFVEEDVSSFVLESWEWMEWMAVDWYSIAAETIGMDDEALWEAVEGGQSLADVAQASGVDPQAVIDAIVEAERAFVERLVDEGELTREEANEWLRFLEEDVKAFVEDNWEDWEGVDWFTIAAETIGVDEEALWEALESGQSIAELAQAHGVDPQAVVDAIVAAEIEWLQEDAADFVHEMEWGIEPLPAVPGEEITP